MTPKEKAKQLKERFENALTVKDCQMIAIDEILKNFGTLTEGQTFYTEYRAVKYYEEVKQELENFKNK